MARMYMERTRTGFGPRIIEDRVPTEAERLSAVTTYYAPKPAWMDYIPGPSLRFGDRIAFDSYIRRTR